MSENNLKGVIAFLSTLIIGMIVYFVGIKDSEDIGLKNSVGDLATQVASLAESTSRLNILMSEIVVPVQKQQDQAISEINNKLDARTETILQARDNDKRLTALEERVADGNGWTRQDHEIYDNGIQARFEAGLERFSNHDRQLQILNERMAEVEGRYTGN